MGSIKEKYLGLSQSQLRLIVVIILVIEAGLLYKFLLEPNISYMKSKQNELVKNTETINRQNINIERLKLEITGQPGENLGASQMADLAESGNSIEYVSKKDDLISELKKVAQRVGGKSVQINEGQLEDAYLNSANRVYRVKVLPAEITMTSNYSGASNFMFQLKSMEKLIRLKGFQMDSSDYVGSINAIVNVDLYLVDDAETAVQEGSLND